LLASAKDSSQRIEWADARRRRSARVVLAACSMDVARAQRELHWLSARREWRALSAVRGSRVFLMDGARHFSTPGPRLAEGGRCSRRSSRIRSVRERRAARRDACRMRCQGTIDRRRPARLRCSALAAADDQ
jgi:hypothetical protein